MALNMTTSTEPRHFVCRYCNEKSAYDAQTVDLGDGRALLTQGPPAHCSNTSCETRHAETIAADAAAAQREELALREHAFLVAVPKRHHAADPAWIPSELGIWRPTDSVFFCGPKGCGKSGTAAALVRPHATGLEWYSCRRLVSAAQAAINKRGPRPTIIDNPVGPRLLVLDDLGAERATDFAMHEVGNVIEARYDACLPVIVTSNLSMRALAARDADPDNPVMGRIVDRLVEMTTLPNGFRHSWPDDTPSRRIPKRAVQS